MPHVLALACLVAFFIPALHSADLVRDGKPVATILITRHAPEDDIRAATELATHVEKMSGAKLAVTPLDPEMIDAAVERARMDGLTAVTLGQAAKPRLEKLLAGKSTFPGTFALKSTKDTIDVYGLEGGTGCGVSELLEQQGVRWFMPGDLGTVIPETKTITVKEQETVQVPSFASRWFQMPDKDWQVRVRCGGTAFPGGHGLKGLPPFKTNPELYGLINGLRVGRQHCLSNPKVLELVVADILEKRKKGGSNVIGMGPNDGRGFCECENCKKLDGGDFDPFSSDPSVTDRYIWFFNQVLAKVNDQYPDTKIAFYIYHTYMRPPVKWKPDPRITGALAPIALDRVHGFSNPVAPEKSYAKWLYQEWGKIMPELYDRGYWSNLADPGFPFIIVHRLRDEIPACHELGVKGWRVETFPNYASTLPSQYIAAKLMWNHKADVDALMEDFVVKFFGPDAAIPMREYFKLMDSTLRDSPHITGSAWDMPHHYPWRLRAEANARLATAEILTRRSGQDSTIYRQRIKLIMESFQLLDRFTAMLESRAKGDFVIAKQHLDKLDAVADTLMNYKPVAMLSAGRFSTYVNYMKRFYRPCTEQAYKRVTDGNKPVAIAKDEWDFLIDPPKLGESIGLFKPDVTGGNWQKIKTSSSSWSNQGYRYYKGLAWYRQTLDVQPEAVGKRVFLWCGGVDEKCKVWVNGKPIGVSPGAAFSPWEMDATDAIRAGKNVVVFAVNNEVVNELGTGGIVAPVMLYAPAAGKDAKLENLRPLGETFP